MKNTNKKIIMLLLTAFVIRLILAGFGTLELDQNTFIAWARRVSDVGFRSFYNEWSDYLPGYIYVLWFLAKVEVIINLPATILYKMPAIISDLATGFLIYKIIQNKKKALMSAALFLFNPAILSNSTLWGQVDIITAFMGLMAVFAVAAYPVSAISLAAGFIVKPQAILAAPIVFVLGLKKKWPLVKFMLYGAISLATLLLLFLPYTSLPNVISFAIERVEATVSQYPYTSVNAFNFWGIFGFWQSDEGGLLSPKNIGTVALVLAGVFTLFNRKLAAAKPYHFLAILLLTNFLFFTRMHERHMLPALIPLVIAASSTPLLWLVYIGLSITYVLNMFYAFYWINNDLVAPFSDFVVKLLSVANIFFFVTLVKQTIKPSKSVKFNTLQKSIAEFLASKKHLKVEFNDRLSKKQEKAIIVFILVLSLAVRVIRLDVPESDYFDEIYHAFTARQILSGDEKPWHWTSAHPEGFAYEWTHPPLAKEIMAVSMKVLGVNPLAWRLPGAVAGVATIYAVYALAKALFKSRDIAVVAAALMALDGLLLTMSRIGTADTYLVAFALISFYLFLRKKDFSSAIFLGLAAATKWSVIWMLPIFAISFLFLRRKFSPSLSFYIILPPLIYLASYLPMFSFGHNLETFWGMQKQMWWYHSGLEATHPYTSPWWSWPIMMRPVYLFQDYQNGVVANIYAIGNPFFFWGGLVSMILAVVLFVKEKTIQLGVLIFSYLVLFVPWALSPRIMFIYHYLPSLPFLAIVMAYILKRYRVYLIPALVLLTVSFIYFYPHWTAITVPQWWDKTYYWFSSWR